MSAIVFTILIFIFKNTRICGTNTFNKSYLSKNETSMIKGIFVILVFLRHYSQYYNYIDITDTFANLINRSLGQCLVTLFLFYSGYGIMEGIKKKKLSFINSFPIRILKLLVHFDIAIVIFWLLSLILKKNFPVKRVLMSFTGWNSIENSNWYIFIMLILYVLTFISFILLRGKNNYISAILLSILSVLLIVFLKQYKDSYWYNTIPCYSMGIWYSLLKEKIEKICMKNDISYLAIIVITSIMYLFFFNRCNISMKYTLVWGVCFAAIVILMSMKITLNNNLLHFLGTHVFSIYILQRIPMIILNEIGYIAIHPYVSFTICILITILLACIFDYYMKKIDSKLFNKR